MVLFVDYEFLGFLRIKVWFEEFFVAIFVEDGCE